MTTALASLIDGEGPSLLAAIVMGFGFGWTGALLADRWLQRQVTRRHRR